MTASSSRWPSATATGLDVEGDACALSAEAEDVQGHRFVSLGEESVEGDGMEPAGLGVQMGEDA